MPETAAEAYGTIRAQLESKVETIGNNDLWIAALAIAVGLTLVTNNEAEFRRVRGLKIQNWAVAYPRGASGVVKLSRPLWLVVASLIPDAPKTARLGAKKAIVMSYRVPRFEIASK